MFQPVAYRLVEPQQVARRKAFAIGRVGDENTFGRGCRFIPLEGHDFEVDVFGYAGTFDVLGGNVDSPGRDVAAVYAMSKFAFVAVVVVECLEKLLVEVLPPFEGKALAEDAGIGVGGDEGGFDENGTRAAHGVDKVFLAVPAGFEYHAGRQHLVDGRLGLSHAVAPLVERLARTVEREGTAHLRDVQVEHHLGPVEAHRGTFAALLHEVVGYGVFGAVGDKFGVFEAVGVGDRVDREGGLGREQRLPRESLHLFINLVGVCGFELVDGFEYSQGSAASQIGFVEQGFVALEGDHAASRLHVFTSELSDLFGQDIFETLERFGYDFKFFGVHDACVL